MNENTDYKKIFHEQAKIIENSVDGGVYFIPFNTKCLKVGHIHVYYLQEQIMRVQSDYKFVAIYCDYYSYIFCDTCTLVV